MSLEYSPSPLHPHIVVIAGEVSGDEIGARIIESLKRLMPEARFSGAPGPSMRRQGCDTWVPMESFQAMGLFHVLTKLPTILRAKKRLLNKIVESQPDIVIFIDQPSFSIHCAKQLTKIYAKKKLPRPQCLQIVAPSVWAYKPKRAEKLKAYIDALFLLYRFEIPYFSKLLPTFWIGHPAMDVWKKENMLEKRLLKKEPLIALYPGSRPQEIYQNLPLQLDAANIVLQRLQKDGNTSTVSWAIQLTDSVSEEEKRFIENEVIRRNLQEKVVYIPFLQRHDTMKKAQAAIAKSGTVTLELALSNTPTVVMYKIGHITQLWAKLILKLSSSQKFSLPNIITRKNLFPEFVGSRLSSENIAASLFKIITEQPSGLSQDDLKALYSNLFPQRSLGENTELSPSDIAAIEITRYLENKRWSE